MSKQEPSVLRMRAMRSFEWLGWFADAIERPRYEDVPQFEDIQPSRLSIVFYNQSMSSTRRESDRKTLSGFVPKKASQVASIEDYASSQHTTL